MLLIRLRALSRVSAALPRRFLSYFYRIESPVSPLTNLLLFVAVQPHFTMMGFIIVKGKLSLGDAETSFTATGPVPLEARH